MSSKICRLCLNEGEIIYDIFTHRITNLWEIILSCTAVEILETDGLPNNACNGCIENIVQFNLFRKRCQYSDQILRKQYLKLQKSSDREPVQSIKRNLSVYENELLLDSLKLNNKNEKCDTVKNNNTSKENPNFYNVAQNFEEKKTEYLNSTDPEYDPRIEDDSDTDTKNDNRKKKCKLKDRKRLRKRSDTQQHNLVYTVEDYAILEGQRKVRIYEIDDTIRDIIGENVYTCEICLSEFQSFFEYYDHQDTHNEQFVFKCTKCTEMFASRQDLVEHDSRHKIPCEICKLEILPKSMTAHLLIHTDIHKCSYCGMRHTSNASLEKHIKARHAGIKGFVCHICGKQSSCQSSMKRHMAYHSSERPYKCKYCDFCAKSMNIVQVHTSRKHFAEKCVCEICAKLFKSQPSLLQHMKRIHTTRKYRCDICGKTFIERYNLNKHLKRHAGQMLHECKICHKEFFTIRMLKEHMHSHRQGCVNCPKCGKEFFYRKYYAKHVLKCTKTVNLISTAGKANNCVP